MKIIPAAAAGLAIFLANPLMARADSGPVGIAFAQAEEGTWWCRDSDPATAFACALKLCKDNGNGQECHPARWCSPAGWSGLMVVWLPEFHSTLPLCGTAGKPSLFNAFKALCDSSEDFTRCDVVMTVGPDGTENEINTLSWPGPAVTPIPDDSGSRETTQ